MIFLFWFNKQKNKTNISVCYYECNGLPLPLGVKGVAAPCSCPAKPLPQKITTTTTTSELLTSTHDIDPKTEDYYYFGLFGVYVVIMKTFFSKDTWNKCLLFQIYSRLKNSFFLPLFRCSRLFHSSEQKWLKRLIFLLLDLDLFFQIVFILQTKVSLCNDISLKIMKSTFVFNFVAKGCVLIVF